MISQNTCCKRVLFIAKAITIGLFITTSVIAQDWYDSDWQYRREVTIDNPVGTELTDYQVLITLDDSFDFSKTNNDGSDIRLTTNNGTTLIPFWFETWEPGTQEATIWIKVPTLPIEGSAVYLYYGNTNPALPPNDPIEVPPAGPFTKDPGNPIIPIGDPGNGEGLLAENIVFDDVTGHYWLLFAAYRSGQSLGLAWSDNPTDPAAWNWDGYVISDANAPHILKHEGTWYIFYADRGHGGPPYPIAVSSSPNVNGPYTYIGSVLESTEPWEAFRVDEPYVFQRNDGTWILMYMGDPGTTEEQIGYAEANDILGPYVKFSGNPCLAFGPPGSFDAGTIADPWVYEYYGEYYIGYTVSPTIYSPWQTALATTSDWQTFTKNGIILPLGNEYDSFRGAVTRIGDTYVFPYTTKITSGSPYQMAIATQPVYMAPPVIINNGTTVFDFFDDFNGTDLDIYKWLFAHGDISQTVVGNGLLTMTATADYVKILGQTGFGMDYVGETRAYHPDQGTQDLLAEIGFSDQSWNVLRIVDDFLLGTTYWQRQAKLAGEPDEFVNMAQVADQDWHVFHVFRESPDIAGFQIDDNPVEIITGSGTANTNVPTMDLPPFLMSYGETNQFVVDWTRVRKWAGADPNTLVGAEQNLINGIDIGLENYGCGKFKVNLKSNFDISESHITNIQFTLKWPANTVNFINFSSDFDVTQQGPVFIENDTNYAIFVSTSSIPVNWIAETEYTVLSFAHDQSGTGYADIVIDTSGWAVQNNGTYYVELMGSDKTGFIYLNLNNVFMGFCGRLEVSAFMQGPFNSSSGLMNTTLNDSGDLPLNQPYNAEPWFYDGSESLFEMPANAVDWVLVELRDAPDAASATSGTRISRQAAILLNDGTITNIFGSPLLRFSTATLQNLFVVLWHRNHLGILSASEVVPFSADNYTYDFTTAASQAYGDGQLYLDNGVYGMIGGDANADGIINMSDAIQVWIPQAGSAGYLNGDLNLDHQVNNHDKNDIWYWNIYKETHVPD